MRRFRYRELLERLPALARMPRSRRAERYLREHFPNAAKEPQRKQKRHRRSDGVREYSLTRRSIDERGGVPYLRVSGKWLERYGFPIGARVYLKAERGKLILTSEDPAGVGASLA